MPPNTNQRKRSTRTINLNKVDELPEGTETERSPALTEKAEKVEKVEKADKAESVGELEDGSGV